MFWKLFLSSMLDILVFPAFCGNLNFIASSQGFVTGPYEAFCVAKSYFPKLQLYIIIHARLLVMPGGSIHSASLKKNIVCRKCATCPAHHIPNSVMNYIMFGKRYKISYSSGCTM
jgi:hypothetical protein